MKLTKEQKEFIENYGRDYLFGGNTKIGEIYGTMQKEIERLHFIIKEAREYITTKYDYLLGDATFLDHDERIDRKQITNILQILDKVEEN